MKNYTELEGIYQIYQEGIFDRVGARIKGIGNTKLFGGSGYNAGKAESFKGKFYARIIKDIDKFLDEIQTMGDIRSLADFETKYPEIAKKIACMADAVGHRTGLTTQCAEPATPGPEKYSCKNGECVVDPLGEYETKEECEAACRRDDGDDSDDDGDDITPPPVELYGYACNKKTGKCVKVKAVKKEGNSLRSAKGTYLYKTLEACKKKCKKNNDEGGNDGGGSGRKPKPSDVARFAITVIGDGNVVNFGDNNTMRQVISKSLKEYNLPNNSKNREAVKKAMLRYRDPKTGRFAKRPVG